MSRSRLAAEYKHATGCGYKTAAHKFGITAGPVAREYKRMYEGVKRVRRDYVRASERPPRPRKLAPVRTERLVGAVAFMRTYSKTAEEAARVFSVPQEEIEALLVVEEARRSA